MNLLTTSLFVTAILSLSACSGSNTSTDPAPQNWHGISFQVDTRPSPPQKGMNEIVVTANDIKKNIPEWDLIISIRSSDQDDWKQMIEDGRMGVYRRAVNVEPGERSTLKISIKHGNEEGELRFPLQSPQ